MATTTSNFSWPIPQSSDLVKDGATAIASLGSGIDTSMAELKGGTTGQMLTKSSNTDMDFSWITPQIGDITAITATSPLTGGGTTGDITVGIQDGTTAQKGAVQLTDSTASTSTTTAATPNAVKTAYDLANAAIPKTLTTTTGDLIYASSANTPARLGIGSTDQVLSVSGGVPVWTTLSASGGITLLSTTTLSGTSTTISSISGSYTNLWVMLYGITGTSAGEFRLNGDTTGVYAVNWFNDGGTAYTQAINNGTLRWNSGAGVSGNIAHSFTIFNYASTASIKPISQTGGFMNSTNGYSNSANGFKNTTSAISSITITSDSGSFSAGTVKIYGVK